MNDNIWLLKFGELFSHSRYILWLSPGANKTPGTAVERQLQQLRSYVEERAEKTDTNISRQMGNMDEKMEAITSMLETLINPKAPEADEEDIGENMWDNYGNEDDEDEEWEKLISTKFQVKININLNFISLIKSFVCLPIINCAMIGMSL